MARGKIRGAMRATAKAVVRWGYAISPAIIFGTALLAWYDPSDASTLFQDSIGTLPVTSAEQPVGLVLDKSRGLVRGPELIVNGDNEAGTYEGRTTGQRGLIAQSSTQARSGTFSAKYTCNDATVGDHLATVKVISAGVPVEVEVWVYNPTGGFASMQLVDQSDGSWVVPAITIKDQWIKLRGYRPAKATTWTLSVGSLGASNGIGFIYYLDDISVREIPGKHLIQPTPASRFTWSKRYNLLTKTEQFSNAAWSKVNSTIVDNAVIAPNGQLVADKLVAAVAGGAVLQHRVDGGTVSTTGNHVCTVYACAAEHPTLWLRIGAVGASYNLRDGGVIGISGGFTANMKEVTNYPGWWKITLAGPAVAGDIFRLNTLPTIVNSADYIGDGVSGIYIWGADLRTAADAALNIPSYQWVDTATSYDEVGFLPYFQLDGVDDSLFSATGVDLTAWNKLTGFSAWTRQADVTAILNEISADATTTPGSFYLATLAGGSTQGRMFGATSGQNLTVAGYSIAETLLAVHSLDLTSPLHSLRDRRVDKASSNTATGGSNFGNHVLNIGRRNNATIPLKGRIYQIFLVGGIPTPRAVEFAERFMAIKSGLALA